MKTFQTLVLLILLFTAKAYSQEEIIAGVENESITTKSSIETENPEALISSVFPGLETIEEEKTSSPTQGLSLETDSSTLPSEETPTSNIELSSPDSQKIDEEVSTTIPEEQETDPSVLPSEEPLAPIIESITPDSQKPEEEIPTTIPEEQESSSNPREPEPSSESPISPTVDEVQSETQGPDSESVSEQQPSETITCICDCGVDSDLPQKCEESLTETVVLENENIPSNESANDPSVSEIEKEIEDGVSVAIEEGIAAVEQDLVSETESPVEDEETLATISPEPETTEAVVEDTASVDSANSSNNLPEEGTESSGSNAPNNANDKETIAETDETLQPAVTASPLEISTGAESEPELNIETTSSISNSPPESNDSITESNQVPTEPEVTNDPLEVSATTINPCTEVGNFPISSTCRQYLSCSGNATNLVAQEIQCPERSAFNPVLQRCTRDLSPCAEEEPKCLLAGSLPNPNGENSSYYWCVPNLLGGFHKYHIQCSINEIFTPLLGRCWIDLPQLGLGLGLINRPPNDRDVVKAEWKLLRKDIKLKAKEEKIRRKMEEKAKARAEKLAAKELKKQQKVVDDDDDDEEEEDDD